MKIKVYLRDRKDPIEYDDAGYFIGMSAKTDTAAGTEVKSVVQYQNNGLLTITQTAKDPTGNPVQKNIAVFSQGSWVYFECV